MKLNLAEKQQAMRARNKAAQDKIAQVETNTMRGRTRKPTALLELSGSASKNKKRMVVQGRRNEPQPDVYFGSAPSQLTEHQTDLWNEVVSEIPPCVLTKSDRILVEMVVRLLEKTRNGSAITADFGTLMRALAQLGMTPADRSRIHIDQTAKSEGDSLDEFVN